jgi:hypothetical protein
MKLKTIYFRIPGSNVILPLYYDIGDYNYIMSHVVPAFKEQKIQIYFPNTDVADDNRERGKG